MDQNHRAFHWFGTGGAMQGKNLEGGMPTSNYRYGEFEPIALVDAIAVRDQVRIEMDACYACSVRCKKVVQIEARAENAGVTKKGKQIAHDPRAAIAWTPSTAARSTGRSPRSAPASKWTT
jgi:aldehyde:ferredoxin oxidoreductase